MDINNAHRQQQSRYGVVRCLFERRAKDENLYIHADRELHGHGKRALTHRHCWSVFIGNRTASIENREANSA